MTRPQALSRFWVFVPFRPKKKKKLLSIMAKADSSESAIRCCEPSNNMVSLFHFCHPQLLLLLPQHTSCAYDVLAQCLCHARQI